MKNDEKDDDGISAKLALPASVLAPNPLSGRQSRFGDKLLRI